jgi:hypothetical protein
MRTLKPLIAAAALLVAGSTALAADKPTRAEKNEARLAELLKDRVAGDPVSCIPTFQANDLQVIDGVAMVYGRGETLYVGRPTNPQSMRWDDVVVIKRTGGQLCNTDIIHTVDRMTGFTTGVVFLEKFVPYTKK